MNDPLEFRNGRFVGTGAVEERKPTPSPLLVLLLAAFAAIARGQGIARVSVSSSGSEASGASSLPDFSHDGRHVAFESLAADLVNGDTNSVADVFVHDRDPDGNGTFDEGNGVTVRVSVASSGAEGDRASGAPHLSADGRFVLFSSDATGLIAGDTNAARDVFVHDRDPDGNGVYDEGNGSTTRVSVGAGGVEGKRRSDAADLSADGRFAAFDSEARDFVVRDRNGASDVFVHDRDPDGNGIFDEGNGITTRVSVTTTGVEGNGDSYRPGLSADGRHVTFHSFASNLTANDTNGEVDVFVHDRDPDADGVFDEKNATTTRLSIALGGAETDGASAHPDPSADGRFVVFDSFATNLDGADGNAALDVFVHDRDPTADGRFDEGDGVVLRLSVGAVLGEGDGDSIAPRISADGRKVLFTSSATNLVPLDANGARDLFVKDRDPDGDGLFDEKHDTVARMSVDRLGFEANDASSFGALSPDGRFAAIPSLASDLVPGDTNGVQDLFVRDATALTLRGVVQTGAVVHFEVEDARAALGGTAWVLLSCSGSSGFAFAPGRVLALSFDGCTLDGLRALPLLSSSIDSLGRARTPDVTAGPVSAGVVLHAAALLIPAAASDLADAAITDPITFATE